MKLFDNFRKKSAQKYLINHAADVNRTIKQVNLNTATSIALLYYLPDEETYKKAEEIIAQLSARNLKTRVVCYSPLKFDPHYFIPKITQDIINNKNLNFRFQPDKAFVNEFVQTEFDILIDLSLSDQLPLLYLATMSRAGLKIGRFDENHKNIYDLMIHQKEDETIESFAKQIFHYLNQINT